MRRIWGVFSFFCLLYLVIGIRLFYWQIVKGGNLHAQAQEQYTVTLPLPSQRGEILASDYKPLVLNQPAYLIYAQTKELVDPLQTADTLSEILNTDAKKLSQAFSDPDRVWVPIGHKVPSPVVEQVKKLALAGVGFEREPTRYYAEASMAAHLLGFVASDQNGRDKGYFGLEGYYDNELKGKDGVLNAQTDVLGAPILIAPGSRIEPQNGRSLVLSLDRATQHMVEKRLKEGMEKYGAKQGSVVVMDPKTGGILAMASHPSYDPSVFGSFDKELYKNPVVAGSYEPGSTFKVIVMSAALNESVVTPITTVDEKGPVGVGEYFIRTWDDKYHGEITMTEVLEKSSNVGMVFVGEKLGKEKFLKYIKDFGFGVPTGIDLQDETSPDLRPDKEWSQIDLATATFGQGIAVTPIQMVRAVSALANGGFLMEPHIVKEILSTDGKAITLRPKTVRRVIGADAARATTDMMVSAVEKGEAKWAKPKGYRIAGKTGTAQIPVAGHYDAEKTIASFVGFAPADDPKFVMLVTLREPASSPWGSETAAPLFFKIARDILIYMNIPPQ